MARKNNKIIDLQNERLKRFPEDERDDQRNFDALDRAITKYQAEKRLRESQNATIIDDSILDENLYTPDKDKNGE